MRELPPSPQIYGGLKPLPIGRACLAARSFCEREYDPDVPIALRQPLQNQRKPCGGRITHPSHCRECGVSLRCRTLGWDYDRQPVIYVAYLVEAGVPLYYELVWICPTCYDLQQSRRRNIQRIYERLWDLAVSGRADLAARHESAYA